MTDFIGKIATGSRFSIIIQNVNFVGDEPRQFSGNILTKHGMPTMSIGYVNARKAKVSEFLNAETGAHP